MLFERVERQGIMELQDAANLLPRVEEHCSHDLIPAPAELTPSIHSPAVHAGAKHVTPSIAPADRHRM
jgi:hypothetical protein